MNDTVVIYDRIRENLFKYTKISISDVSNISINETLARTIITSVTTLLAVIHLYIRGRNITRFFICNDFRGNNRNLLIHFCCCSNTKVFKVNSKTLEKEEEKILP